MRRHRQLWSGWDTEKYEATGNSFTLGGINRLMNRKIIVIGGYLASGKSSFVLRLTKETGVPYFEGLLESAKRFLADKSAHKKTGTLRPFVV